MGKISITTGLFISLMFTLSANGYAQTTTSQICNIQALGMVFSTQAWLDENVPFDVAMQEIGLRPDGPRYQMSKLAYELLTAGKSETDVNAELRTLCLKFDAEELMADDPFHADIASDESPLCIDLAAASADAVLDAKQHNYSFASAMSPFAQPDNRAQPLIHKAVSLGMELAKNNGTKRSINQKVMHYCENLTVIEKDALSREFYTEGIE